MAIETTLIAAAIGGGLALSGTIVSQIFGLLSGHIQRRHERDIRQRERLERLADAVGESLLWLHEISKWNTIEDIQSQPPPPAARRAVILSAIYFPALFEPAADYANALLAYYHLAIDCFEPGRQASVGAQIVLFVQSHPEAQKICDDVLHFRTVLDEAIAKEAKKYQHI